jgi:hypothetical protein
MIVFKFLLMLDENMDDFEQYKSKGIAVINQIS